MAAMKPVLILVAFLGLQLSLSTNVFAAEDLYSHFPIQAADAGNYQANRNFLIGLGFKDYSEKIETTLQQSGVTDIAKQVLKKNEFRGQIVNSARELASFMFSSKDPQFLNDEKNQQMMALCEFLLLPFKDANQNEINQYAKINHVKIDSAYSYMMRERMVKEKNSILSLMVQILDLPDQQVVGELDHYLSRYLQIYYTEFNNRETQYLGRAMTASYVRYLRLQHRSDVEAQFKRQLLSHKIFLNNFISNQLSFFDNANRIQTVTLSAGDFANEYSKDSESYFISIGTVPGSLRNRYSANVNNLLGNPFIMPVFPTPETASAILNKVENGQPLTTHEKFQYYFLQNKKTIPGFSHVGLVDIKTDAETGIQMSWVWDIYPDQDIGSMRFIGIEGFAYAGDFQKVGFAHYDPVKFLRYYQSQIRQRGYLSKVWMSSEAQIEDGVMVPDDSGAKYFWMTKMLQTDFEKSLNVKEVDAGMWFKNFITPRITNVMEDYMVGPAAMAFANDFHNIRGAAYCSQLIVLAYLQGVDVDPEIDQDKVSLVVRIGKAMKMSDLTDMDFNQRIISPAGFAWQRKLLGSFSSIMLQQKVDVQDTSLNTSLIESLVRSQTRQFMEQQNLSNFKDVSVAQVVD
jgi:hypothetical protein